jgi:hypothetical protein
MRALLADGVRTSVVAADLREPGILLAAPASPIGVLLVAVLHFIRDSDDPERIVARLRDAMPAGSHFAISHGTQDFSPERVMAAVESAARSNPVGAETRRSRTRNALLRWTILRHLTASPGQITEVTAPPSSSPNSSTNTSGETF